MGKLTQTPYFNFEQHDNKLCMLFLPFLRFCFIIGRMQIENPGKLSTLMSKCCNTDEAGRQGGRVIIEEGRGGRRRQAKGRPEKPARSGPSHE